MKFAPSQLKLHSLLWLAIVMPLFLTIPLQLFSNNFADFNLGALQIGRGLLPFALVLALLPIFTAALPGQKLLTLGLLWLAIAIYIKGNLVVWDYGPFDGSEIPWDRFAIRGTIDTSILVMLLAIVIVGRRLFLRHTASIVVCLCVLQISTALITFTSSPAPLKVAEQKSNDAALFEFSPKQNVLFIILDEFSSRAFYQMLQAQPELKRTFADFTFYRDLLGHFPTTYPSLPTILSGKLPDVSGSMFDYLKEATHSSINEQLARKGWSAESVMTHPMCGGFTSGRCRASNVALNPDSATSQREALYKLLDLTLFRVAPHDLKPAIYNDDNWLLQTSMDTTPHHPSKLKKGFVTLQEAPHHRTSSRLIELFIARSTNSAPQPTFKLLHLLIPHSPHSLGPDCSGYIGPRPTTARKFINNGLCALNLCQRLFAKMREISVYDSTTIVIAGDHGTSVGFDFPEFGEPVHKRLRRAFPLLLIKAPHHRASPGEEIRIDERPLSQADILALVADVGNIDIQAPPQQDTSSPTTRVFYDYVWSNLNWSSGTLPATTPYTVRGDAWLQSNWQMENKLARTDGSRRDG